MYHCLLAIVVKHGFESRNQECTFACVETLINEDKVELDKSWLKKIADFDEKEMEEEEVIKLREEFQYGTETVFEDTKVKKLVDDTKEFIELVRVALK